MDKHDSLFVPSDMTVDTWFEYWVENIVGDLASSTRRKYCERYKHNIQPVRGMPLAAIKPMYCKMVLNRKENSYSGSTIRPAYIAMGTMLRPAVRYVYVTDDSLSKAVLQFEQNQQIQNSTVKQL